MELCTKIHTYNFSTSGQRVTMQNMRTGKYAKYANLPLFSRGLEGVSEMVFAIAQDRSSISNIEYRVSNTSSIDHIEAITENMFFGSTMIPLHMKR